MVRRMVIFGVLLLFAGACRPTAPMDTALLAEPELPREAVEAEPPAAANAAAPGESGESAEVVFERIEAALASGEYRLEYTIEAEGALAATVTGMLVVTTDAVQLRARGRFDGQPLLLEFTADAERMRGRSGEQSFDLPRGEALREALAIGLTRMGLLHNIAVLGRGRPPDRADGGVRTWVEARALRRSRAVTAIATREPLPDDHLSMDIAVNGNVTAQATLFLDRDGLPVLRHQVVSFSEGPEGEMRVREHYDWL